MAKRYLDTDPLSGTKHYVDYDPVDDAFHYITEYDPTELLRHNHFMRSEQPRSTFGKDMVFAARLPSACTRITTCHCVMEQLARQQVPRVRRRRGVVARQHLGFTGRSSKSPRCWTG